MAQVLSPQMHSSPLLGNTVETSRWGDFDYSMIHPAHGISFDSWQETGSMSQAEQLLSSLGFEKHGSANLNNDNEEDDLFNLDWARPSEDSPMDGHDVYHRQLSSGSLSGIADNDSDSAYDSSTSDSSVETVTPSSSMSLISIHDPALSSFPFPEGATHTTRKRSSVTRKEQKAKTRYSPSIQLERISSCHFNPPTLSSQDVPLDATLQQQYNSSSSSSSSYTTKPNWASSSSSSSSLMQASASSSMIRSYSAPTHTQAEYDLLKTKWNEESAAARASAASSSSSYSITHSASSSQLSPTRPSFGRRASSAATSSSASAYSSSMGLRRTRDHDEASASSPDLSSYVSQANEPYSSRTHLLSPVKHTHPFKRSRLAYVSEEIPAYVHKDGASREQIFGPPSSPTNTGGQAATTATYSSMTPPKSPNRPSLNRFFTSPEFFVGSAHPGNESSDDDGDL